MAFLELRGVGKSYWTPRGRYSVLDDLSLDVEAGEFVCIVGYSGSGKTTLVSLIAGLLEPDAGEIRLGGEPIRGPSSDLGIVFQNYSLLAWMSVFENIYLAVNAVSLGATAVEKCARTHELIAAVNLSAAAHKRPHELSGGMRQRVAVARGLAMNPKLLLLDEPFSALDALTRATLQSELARIWMEERKTVVMITNDVEEAILLADRIYPLTPGPGARLGPQIVVDLPHPRSSRALNLEPAYHHARRDIVEFLANQRRANSGATPPLTPALKVVS
jgi:nitrate/nitrite transport system ATP-binding protein